MQPFKGVYLLERDIDLLGGDGEGRARLLGWRRLVPAIQSPPATKSVQILDLVQIRTYALK